MIARIPNRSTLRTLFTLAATVPFLTAAPPLLADENEEWPREIETPEATITIYQPQPQDFEGTKLTGRSAVSVLGTGEDSPIFGTAWFEARVTVDRDDRSADIEELKVPRVRFPNASEEQEAWLVEVLERELPQANLSMSLDRLSASLEVLEERRQAAQGLNDEPPRILFSQEPAVLVTIDGDPELRDLEESELQYVVNTPFMIVLVEKQGTYYLYAGEDRWYSAPAVEGPWDFARSVPKKVSKLAPEDPQLPEDVEEEISQIPAPSSPPKIVVANQPTELVVTDGKPEYAPIEGGELLYVSNSDDDILIEVTSQSHYLLLAGRWFAAPGLDGPWEMVRADELPESFQDIPVESGRGHLRTWIAGTEESEQAVLDAQVPQTAAIKRDATIEVEWDGKPKFERIADTELEHGINTPEQVLRYDDHHYCAHQGVWYESASPTGPWSVATEIPDVIYQQPASSPTYNTTYVYVFDTTPDVVHTGYYPGYTHSYIYYGVPVYGTGWYYRPWWGSHYYPRASTWGFHVRYNPWYGWSFGFSYSTGRFTFGLGFGGWGGYRRGWWGPVGYRPYYRAGYQRGWRHGYRAGYRAAHRQHSPNLYARPANAARNARPVATTRAAPNVAGSKSNNVYSDRNGNVYRRQADGSWQQNKGGQWSSADVSSNRPTTRDQSAAATQRPTTTASPSAPTKTPTQRPSTGASSYGGSGNLNQQYQSRQRGTNRARSYGGGGARGGGGGRRR